MNVCLEPDGLTSLLSFFASQNLLLIQQTAEILRRLYIPGYERARFHVQAAIAANIINPLRSPGYYLQSEITKVLEWANAKGLKP